MRLAIHLRDIRDQAAQYPEIYVKRIAFPISVVEADVILCPDDLFNAVGCRSVLEEFSRSPSPSSLGDQACIATRRYVVGDGRPQP